MLLALLKVSMRPRIGRNLKPSLMNLDSTTIQRYCHETRGSGRESGATGYPILLRPSFVLGGRGMFIVYDEEELNGVVNEAFAAALGNPSCSTNFWKKRSSLMLIVSPMAKPL